MPTATSSPVLSWRAPEFYYYQKGSSWFTALFALAVLLALYFLIFRQLDWTAALLALMGAFALYRLATRKPRQQAVEISERGVKIGERFIPFAELASFHLTDHGDYTTVDWQPKRAGLPFSALVGEQAPTQIRAVLGRYLPEKSSDTNHINDLIGRLLRF